MQINSVTGKDDTFFDLIEASTATRSLDQTRNTRLQMTFSMSSQVTSISREVYNAFMLFGDVGGFSGLLFTLNAIIVSIFTYNNAENSLVESLFRLAPD